MSGLGLLTEDPVWKKLESYYKENKDKLNLRDLFANEATRFDKYRYADCPHRLQISLCLSYIQIAYIFLFIIYCLCCIVFLIIAVFVFISIEVDLPCPNGGGPALVDYSKNLIDDNVLALLFDLAKSRKVEERRNAMFGGEKINSTENRAVLHYALRARADDPPINLDGRNIIPEIQTVLKQIETFVGDVIGGKWLGHSGKKITDVVNIGIGGSDLVRSFYALSESRM